MLETAVKENNFLAWRYPRFWQVCTWNTFSQQLHRQCQRNQLTDRVLMKKTGEAGGPSMANTEQLLQMFVICLKKDIT